MAGSGCRETWSTWHEAENGAWPLVRGDIGPASTRAPGDMTHRLLSVGRCCGTRFAGRLNSRVRQQCRPMLPSDTKFGQGG